MFSIQKNALVGGLSVSLIMILVGAPEGIPDKAWLTAACMALMAIWWVTEATHPAVTALLPLVLFPLLDINSIQTTANSYAHPIIYLFFGGFLLSLAITKWQLHKRIAMLILLRCSSNASTIIAGFMITAALLSMWISNTATTLMLLPIGLAIITVICSTIPQLSTQQKQDFQTALLLSIAYAATVGGVATLIGTPPNAYMAAFILENYQIDISFIRWMAVGLPITLVMLPCIWWLLCKYLFVINFTTSSETRQQLREITNKLGPCSVAEKRVIAIFTVVVLLWGTRPLLNNLSPLAQLSDSSIAVFAGIMLFLLPATKTEKILHWKDTAKLPWGILVLFGGGLALAGAVTSSGLATTIGQIFSSLTITDWLFIALLVLTIVFLTEISGNLSVVATFLPVVAAIAIEVNVAPLMFIVPVTLAASCAFMLPVATPPNAIVYSAEKFSINQMSRAGLILNIFAILLITALVNLLVPAILIV